MNGAKQDAVNYKLDGADHNDSWFSSSMVYPNPDALQEFTVQTNNFTAQYGRDGGAVITGVVKSGTNEYHGTLYWYLRNDVLDARPFHAAERPTFRRGQYGATVGGPIVKDKTFWFFAYEGTRQFGAPGVKTYTTLDAAERAGDFSGLGNTIKDPLTGDPFPNNLKWGIHFIQVHPMGCGLAAPEQECEIARIVRVAAKPTHTRIHCGGSLRAATPRIGRATQPHAAPEQ